MYGNEVGELDVSAKWNAYTHTHTQTQTQILV